jgi:hypothetical protein
MRTAERQSGAVRRHGGGRAALVCSCLDEARRINSLQIDPSNLWLAVYNQSVICYPNCVTYQQKYRRKQLRSLAKQTARKRWRMHCSCIVKLQ